MLITAQKLIETVHSHLYRHKSKLWIFAVSVYELNFTRLNRAQNIQVAVLRESLKILYSRLVHAERETLRTLARNSSAARSDAHSIILHSQTDSDSAVCVIDSKKNQ